MPAEEKNLNGAPRAARQSGSARLKAVCLLDFWRQRPRVAEKKRARKKFRNVDLN
jgi:hypothetical protein